MNLERKKVLITGASSGIGKELAFCLASKKAIPAIASRNLENLNKIAAEIKLKYPGTGGPLVIPCDVTDKAQVKNMLNTCIRELGEIDILINNAGIGVYGDFQKMAIEDYEEVMKVNFLGAVNCVLAAVSFMKKAGRGMIVNVTSAASMHGVPYLSAYSASKAALVSFSQSIAAELSNTKIKVCIVSPGYVQTDFFKNEKKVGGATRPSGNYHSPIKIAKKIVGGIEKERIDIDTSWESKMLRIFLRISPWLVERVMEKIAKKLRVKEVN
ncbi:MAG: SDR family oxidoreductase [Acidobacteria bacterium]|jgi:hypothetical protein|nr:SDR family oxidoreductase [Acidobacteriota bacterium]